MERTTVMLPGDLKEKAMFKANNMKISFGELVRKSIENFINDHNTKLSLDPFIIDNEVYDGIVETDLSQNHDKYIYGE